MANAKTTAKNSNWLAGALTLTEQADGSSISTGEMGFVRVGDVMYLKNAAGTLVALANAAGAIPIANAATTAALAACTYANGTLGVGATLTADANGALGAIDGVTLTAGQSLLVKNQVSAPQNGLYTVTQVGTAGLPFILTRDERFDQAAEMQDGWAVIVAAGTANADTLWLLTASVATVGTNNVTFARESGVMLLASTQTNTGPKTFTAAGVAKINNAGDTFATTLASAATAARTATFPDASVTLASAGVATGADGTGATGGTAPAFTGTAAVDAVVEAFTGTGFATAGQVVTTTDNHTMTLNQCARMWLITATQAPCLIVSNTAVTGAPAVLTVYGLAPVTNAETYKILIAPTPVGTVASHTHTGPSHTHTQA